MIKGYASVFFDGTERTEYSLGSRNGREFVERISQTAFENALQRSDDVVALFNHDPNNVLGRSSSGTLKLTTDSRGLAYEITPAETTVSQDVLRMQERGDIPGSSFSFRVDKEEITEDGEKLVRNIEDLTLFDVGPVTYPAYDGTSSRCVRFTAIDGQLCRSVRGEQRNHAIGAFAGYLDSLVAVQRREEAEAVEVRLRTLELDNSTPN